MKIPSEILNAVNSLLAPYGVKYDPAQNDNNASAPSRGYLGFSAAAKYTGVSVSTLRRAVADGRLRALRPTEGNGYGTMVRLSYEDLDAFMHS